MTDEIKVGDKVTVTDSGSNYSTYKRMAEKLGLTNYRELTSPLSVVRYSVVGIDSLSKIVGIENGNGSQYLVHVNGLRLDTKSKQHPHHDHIVLWAKDQTVVFQCYSDKWDVWKDQAKPQWEPQLRYRVKPKKTPQEVEKEEIIKEMSILRKRLEKLEVVSNV